MRTCSIDGCDNKHVGRGMCHKHVTRFYRHGDPLVNKHKKEPIDVFNDGVMPVTESGCWLWTKGLNAPNEYGRFTCRGKDILAHRFAWEHYVGAIPNGSWVLHKCDTPSCVNPDHLFLGTHQDNMNDAVKKRRMRHKITTKEIYQLKDLHGYGFTQCEIADMYSVFQGTVSHILLNKRSKHGI